MSAVQSPLFEPVFWDGDSFRVLDELLIPQRVEYIRVTEASEALAAVRDMKTRAYGQVLTFLYTAALVAQQYQDKEAEPLRRRIAQLTQQFCDVRPTFDFHGLGSHVEEGFNQLQSGSAVGETIAHRAREFGASITRARRARAERAATLLPDGARVMTHCNVSGELVAVANYCQELGKKISVIATETRPYLQGARLTAWELAQACVPVSLIPDCAVAQVMADGAVDAVIVGADRSAQNGDIINKVGTYPLALMAKEYGVPFYALVQDPRTLTTGADVPIEERPAAELLFFQGEPLLAQGVERIAARYPSFDITPATLITHLIGFEDLYTPETFRRKFQKAEVNTAQRAAKPLDKYLLIYGIPAKNQYSFLMSVLRAEECESFLVPEMRPQLCGARLVANQLIARNAPTTLIADNIMGTLFANGEIRKLCLFSESVTETGPQGICGSLLAVHLARLHDVPIELYDGDRPSGSCDRDVSTFIGKPICPEGVAIWSVGAEVIPWALFKNDP